MTRSLQRCLVLGSGTMGAALAAHLVNAGFQVSLLDLAAQGEDRNRIPRSGLRKAREARPAAFFVPAWAEKVQLGNLEDNLEWARDADWVLEAVVEDLGVKQDLMARLESARGAHTVITTNTSGIPVAKIAEGRSPEFRRHFLGTHFFNPPRYLPLMELIPLSDTSAEAIGEIERVADLRLGKTVVHAKDTPNFIANRLGSVAGAFVLDFALREGYSVEEVDALTGPLLGRPKTATFRLLDLVGLDTASLVRSHLADALPNDEAAPLLCSERAARITDSMMARGWLGNKAGAGFYKAVESGPETEYWVLDFETLEHRAQRKPDWAVLQEARAIDDLGVRMALLLADAGRAGRLARAVVFHGLRYASGCVPEIADGPYPIDQAVRAGFLHSSGPFEMWDSLGVPTIAARMAAEGYPPAEWVTAMLQSGRSRFYDLRDGTPVACYSFAERRAAPLPPAAAQAGIQVGRESAAVLEHNDGARLLDLGDGVIGLEIRSKGNTLDQEVIGLIQVALDWLDDRYTGLVLMSSGEDFSLGANLFLVAAAAQSGLWDQLDHGIRELQQLAHRLRHSPRPVVVAVSGRALGGGAELSMAAPRIVAAAESYFGLVELAAGVVPAGGGCKEMLRRVLNPAMRVEGASALPFLQKVMETIGQAKVGMSAEESRGLGFLVPADRVVMNPRRLVSEAKREVLHLAPGYQPPPEEAVFAAGRDGLAALRVGVFTAREARQITEYEAELGNRLAYVLCGGELSRGTWVEEQYILDLEREAFLALCGQEKTQERMWHLLQKRKPLRN
jgi:3-hydroxyacyl-CoA dehydrogenase